MNKLFGSICMVAGTAIGAGMIALPMTLAKFGVVGSLSVMILTWFLVYYSALIGSELTLKVENSLSLSDIAFRLSGKTASVIATTCVMVLSYALISAYLYGGSSITTSLIQAIWVEKPDQDFIIGLFAIIMAVILILGITWIDYFNRVMFLALIALLGVTIIALGLNIEFSTIPAHTPYMTMLPTWSVAIPVLFTSFGFQMMIPSLSQYLNRNSTQLKKAFFWGSSIPVAIYLAWTLSTVGVLSTNNPDAFDRIIHHNVDVGEFVGMLSQSTSLPHLQLFIWGVSFFAIITSALGVALGLIDLWKTILGGHTTIGRLVATSLTMIPPFVIALLTPDAFIKALGFAGMILVVIAVVLPVYLLFKSDHKSINYAYAVSKSKTLRFLALVLAFGVIGFEIINLLNIF